MSEQLWTDVGVPQVNILNRSREIELGVGGGCGPMQPSHGHGDTPPREQTERQKHITENITFPQTTYAGGKNVLDSTFVWRIKMLVYLPDWNTSSLQGAAQLMSLFGWNSLVVLTNHYQNRRLDLNKNDNWITHSRLHLKKTLYDLEAHTIGGLSFSFISQQWEKNVCIPRMN